MVELDNKAQAMLKLIEEDADSFAKRAVQKSPELISLVEDFYGSHRLLAERPTLGLGSSGKFDSDDYAESEVDDPEHCWNNRNTLKINKDRREMYSEFY
ncbi:hypothetical protein V6N13_090802 [Hibiscus sabdariffa]